MPSLADILASIGVIADPSQRPGPAGTLIENKQRGGPGDAQVNLLKGNNVIEVGPNTSPVTLAHEVGHTAQNQGNSTASNTLRSVLGFGGAIARGGIGAVYDQRIGAEREVNAGSQGLDALRAAAEGGDPEARKLLEQMGEVGQNRLESERRPPGETSMGNFFDDMRSKSKY